MMAARAPDAATEREWIAQHRAAVARRMERMPSSVVAHVLAGWDERIGWPDPRPGGQRNGSPVAAPNTWALTLADDLHRAHLTRAYDEDLIRDYAENYAQRSAALPSLSAAEGFARAVGVEPPQGKHVTEQGAWARLVNPLWWRRQLRKAWTREAENGLREAGMIRKGCQPYASDEAVRLREARVRRTREWAESRVLVNGEGEQLEMLPLMDRSLANPALRRGEFMCRMRGFEEIARDLGHVATFWTLTTPSRFHAQLSAGGANPAHSRETVRDAQLWLRQMWARARAKLHRLSVLMYGFRVAEPHHDGTPHWHMVLFTPASAVETMRLVIRGVWLSDGGAEPGAQEHRAKCVEIEPDKGSATGYVSKYVAKNIDGAGAIGGEVSDETGTPVIETVQRVAAWASAHGIRQFQQIGGPPVGLWRECRRLRDQVDDADIERARAAADRGDWRAFIYALSFDHIKAGRKVALKIERDEEDHIWYREEAASGGWHERVHAVKAVTGANAYGEVCRGRIVGLRYCGKVIVTRPHRWRIERKCASVAQSGTTSAAPARFACAGGNGSFSGSESAPQALFSDLGPVAITVREAWGGVPVGRTPPEELREIERAEAALAREIEGLPPPWRMLQ